MKLSIFRAILVVTAAAAVAAEPQILSSVLSPVLAATGLSAPIGLLKVTTDTELMKEGLDFAGNLTEFTTSLISNTSDHVTQLARNGLNSTTELGHKALKGGVQVTKQGLGFAKTVSKHVPGYSTVISMGTKVGLTGLPLVETVAEKGLTLVNKGGDKVLTLSNNAIKGGAGTVNTVAQTGIGIGRDVVDRVDKAKNKFTGTLNRISGGILFRKTRSLGAKRRIHQESIGEK
uniref:Chemotaxis protein CheA n=1 Tax=Lygus hesperus TaxID=30085 RepID=A0A0A9Y9W5_LYGHE